MTVWLDCDGTGGGHVAIYTGNDDAPMSNPVAHIGGRLKFSTLLAYLPFVPAKMIVKTGSAISVPGNIGYTARSPMRRTIDLGAHGMAGVPFIYGFVTISGIIRPLCGTVPIHYSTGHGGTIHWTLGVSATRVFISEGRSYYNYAGVVQPTRVEVYVSDKVI